MVISRLFITLNEVKIGHGLIVTRWNGWKNLFIIKFLFYIKGIK